jgi:hypothetical protein
LLSEQEKIKAMIEDFSLRDVKSDRDEMR